jgi:hypothetical protein
MKSKINVTDVNEVVLETNGAVSANVSSDGHTLYLYDNMNPMIVDRNFAELDERLRIVEETIKNNNH